MKKNVQNELVFNKKELISKYFQQTNIASYDSIRNLPVERIKQGRNIQVEKIPSTQGCLSTQRKDSHELWNTLYL